MGRLKNQTVFNFCAIPQVMAIATLARLYNNPRVFTSVVKIRKGTAVSLMLEATSMPALYCIFQRYIDYVASHAGKSQKTAAILQQINRHFEAARVAGLLHQSQSVLASATVSLTIGFLAGLYFRPLLAAKLASLHG
jgi:phytoene/squalene synthetase